jgi:hypothetical protein
MAFFDARVVQRLFGVHVEPVSIGHAAAKCHHVVSRISAAEVARNRVRG